LDTASYPGVEMAEGEGFGLTIAPTVLQG
jgi:hypothetical protein